MNCPHCGKRIAPGRVMEDRQSAEKRDALSGERAECEGSPTGNPAGLRTVVAFPGTADKPAVPHWISADAWHDYLEINQY